MQTISFLFCILLHVSTSQAACGTPAEGNCQAPAVVDLGSKPDAAACQAACAAEKKAGCCSYEAGKACVLDPKGLSISSAVLLASKPELQGNAAAKAEIDKEASGQCTATGCKPLVLKSVCDAVAFLNVDSAASCMTKCATIPEATCCQFAVDKTSKKHCKAKLGTATPKPLASDPIMSNLLTEWKSGACTAAAAAAPVQNSGSSASVKNSGSAAVSASWTSLSGEQWVKIVALLEFLFAGFLTLKYCTMKQSQKAQMSYTLLKEQEA